MIYICQNTKCLKVIDEQAIIRMPFQSILTFWCKDCYNKWADECPRRNKIKVHKTKQEGKKK